MNTIFSEITHAFNSLWKCRQRGESIEIITPFPTSSDMYVSVFLTQRGDAWVVSDGGWMCQGMYNCEIPYSEKIYKRVLSFFIDDYGVKTTPGAGGKGVFYYKGTKNRNLVPNIVFDLANFISVAVSTALVEFREQEEYERFNNHAKKFLRSRFSDDRITFNATFSEKVPMAKFSAVIKNGDGTGSLINFISGKNRYNIRTGFARSNMNFDLLEDSPAKELVDNKFVLFDDSVSSMNSNNLAPLIQTCRNRGRIPISWEHSRNEIFNKLRV